MTAPAPPFAIDPALLELDSVVTAPVPVVAATVFRIFRHGPKVRHSYLRE